MGLNGELARANAVLTAISSTCMVLAFAAVRRKRLRLHRNLMLVAFGAATIFLALFVVRFVEFGPTRFSGSGLPAQIVFYAIYFTHEPTAVVSVPLVVVTAALGLRGAILQHREMARVALPIWLYSSLTGLFIYLFLYGPF
jgi:putative membrane protein